MKNTLLNHLVMNTDLKSSTLEKKIERGDVKIDGITCFEWNREVFEGQQIRYGMARYHQEVFFVRLR